MKSRVSTLCRLHAGLVLALFTALVPVSAQVNDLVPISRNGAGELGNEASFAPAVGNLGDLVVFESRATNLVDSDSNGSSDIFGFQGDDESLIRLSLATSGVEVQAPSTGPVALSSDGNMLAFLSRPGAYIEAQTGAQLMCEERSLVLKNRQTSEATELLLSADGEALNGFSYPAALSADGQYLLIVSSATNLAADLDSGTRLVLYDNLGKTTQILRKLTSDSIYDEYPFQAAMSADGRYIVYTSCDATVAPSGKVNMACHCQRGVYLYDRAEGTSILVSSNAQGEAADATCSSPAISADGKVIAFSSAATNLVPPVVTPAAKSLVQAQQIYLFNRVTAEMSLGSVNSSGEPANGDCDSPRLSATGQYLVFTSEATNLFLPDQASAACVAQYLFRLNMTDGSLIRVEQDPDQELKIEDPKAPALSGNGLKLAFEANAAALTQTESSRQIYLATFDGEPDSLIIEEPSLKSLMRSVNRAVATTSPLVRLKGRKAIISVQGFESVKVSKARAGAKVLAAKSSGKRAQKYLSRYEVNIKKRKSAAGSLSALTRRATQAFKLAAGDYSVSYRVFLLERGSQRVMKSKRSPIAQFSVQ